MTTPTEAFQAELAAIVGAAHSRPAEATEAVDGMQVGWVVAPGSGEEVAAVLRAADRAAARLAPRGGGTKGGWGVPPTAVDLVLSTRRLDGVREHAWGDMTATVAAGTMVAALQAVLAAHGQRLALDPLWPERATVGGILSTNDSGSLRERYGALRDLILGVQVALPDGTLARAGGKVVKNVAGYDLPKLLTGAWGTLGVITEATFRLYPLPAATRSFTISAPQAAPLQALLLALRSATLVPTGLQWRAGSHASPALDVRLEGAATALDTYADLLLYLAQAAGCADGLAEADPAVWQAGEALWADADAALLCKVGVLPADVARLGEQVAPIVTSAGGVWRLALQAVGVGWLRLEGEAEALPGLLAGVRAAVGAGGGSLVVMGCPPSLKPQMDVWGAAGDAVPLMRRVKGLFDPHGLLNPGRFVGGI